MQKDKIRDMIRSILPSKAVKGARTDRTQTHRANRKKVRQTLHQYNQEGWEDEDKMVMRLHESDFVRRRNIREMVRDRREADKLNHFVRWCKEKTKHISEDNPQERYDYIANLIGGSGDVIREHALGHFISPWEFNIEASGSYRWRYRDTRPVLFTRDAFEKALTWCFEHCPGRLNEVLKGKGYDGFVMTWRSCTNKDGCISTRVVRQLLYSYQTTWGWNKTSWDKPWSYREGTLSSQKAERVLEEHDEKTCANKIIVYRREDLDRITDKIFGWKANTNYRGTRSFYGNDGLADRLLPLFFSKGLLEDRREI